jgi:hypothetical protein
MTHNPRYMYDCPTVRAQRCCHVACQKIHCFFFASQQRRTIGDCAAITPVIEWNVIVCLRSGLLLCSRSFSEFILAGFEANWNRSVVGLNKRRDLIDCTRMLLDNINQKNCVSSWIYSLIGLFNPGYELLFELNFTFSSRCHLLAAQPLSSPPRV